VVVLEAVSTEADSATSINTPRRQISSSVLHEFFKVVYVICYRHMTAQWELWCGPIMMCGWLQEIMQAMWSTGRVTWIMWRCSRHIRRQSEVSGTGTALWYKHNTTVRPCFISSFISHLIISHHSWKFLSSYLLVVMLQWLINCCLFWE